MITALLKITVILFGPQGLVYVDIPRNLTMDCFDQCDVLREQYATYNDKANVWEVTDKQGFSFVGCYC